MSRLRPEQYGMRTVHTGNRNHRESTSDMRNLAKRYGLAHGYSGAIGGWILNKEGQHVAHGWGEFWHTIGGMTIVAWARREKRRIPESLQGIGK